MSVVAPIRGQAHALGMQEIWYACSSECPINFSLSRRHDKLKHVGHQTDPLLQSRTGLIEAYIGQFPEWRVGNMHGDANELSLNWIEKVMVT
jgi:hypothetical protein